MIPNETQRNVIQRKGKIKKLISLIESFSSRLLLGINVAVEFSERES